MEHTGALLSNCAAPPWQPAGVSAHRWKPRAHTRTYHCCPCCWLLQDTGADRNAASHPWVPKMPGSGAKPFLGHQLPQTGSRSTVRPGKLWPFSPAPGWGDREKGRLDPWPFPDSHQQTPHPGAPSPPPPAPAAPAVSPRPFLPQPRPLLPQSRQPRPLLPQPRPFLPQPRPFLPSPGSSGCSSLGPGSSHSPRGPRAEEVRPGRSRGRSIPGPAGRACPGPGRAQRSVRAGAVPAHQPQRGGRHQRGAERVPGGRELHSGRRKGRSGAERR